MGEREIKTSENGTLVEPDVHDGSLLALRFQETADHRRALTIELALADGGMVDLLAADLRHVWINGVMESNIISDMFWERVVPDNLEQRGLLRASVDAGVVATEHARLVGSGLLRIEASVGCSGVIVCASVRWRRSADRGAM